MKPLSSRFGPEYTAALGAYTAIGAAVSGYASALLLARGCTNREIGFTLGAGTVAALVLQPLAADLTDRSRRISVLHVLLALGGVMAAALLALGFGAERSALLAAVYVVLLCANQMAQPFSNSLCLELALRGARINFGAARGTGALCYAVFAAALGLLVRRVGTDAVPFAGLAVTAAFLAVTALIFVQCRRSGPDFSAPAAPGEHSRGIGAFLRDNPRFLLLMAGVMLAYLPHMVYSNFLVRVVLRAGGGEGDLGLLGGWCALTELPAMFLFSRLLRRFRSGTLLCFSALMFACKQLAICLASTMPALFAAQLLEGLSYAVFIPATVRYMEESVPRADAVKGQTLITAMLSLASVAASLLGGVLLDTVGLQTTLFSGVFVALAGFALLIPAVRSKRRAKA